MSDRRAIILAGGKGTRLRPYTTLIPKPLVPIGGRFSILEIVLMQLARRGFTRATLAVNHLSHLMEAYFGDGERLGLAVDYSVERTALNTIGPLTLIPDLPEHFLVMNGDIFCDIDYGAFLAAHAASDADITVASFKRTLHSDFGVLQFDDEHRLTGFREKPVYELDVSMGIYAMGRHVIEALPRGRPYGFDELMIDGVERGMTIRVRPFDGFWLDIGRHDDYQYADEHADEILARIGLDAG